MRPWYFLLFVAYLFQSQLSNALIPKIKFRLDKPRINIAIIDTGLDIKNKVFQPFLWKNPGESGLDLFGNEKGSNLIDDDHNGYVDDVHGWNFVQNNNLIEDNYGHGTHVTGVILQQIKLNSEGSAHFMILKYYDSPKNTTQTPFEFSKKALKYAIQNGANIINYSGGGKLSDKEEEFLILEAEKKGILLISAAGNEGQLLDQFPYFPSSYPLKNILKIGSFNEKRSKSIWSNFDKDTIFAPGENLVSFLPHSKTGSMSGTSQATAWVTGFVIRKKMNITNLFDNNEKIRLQKLIYNEFSIRKQRLSINFNE